MVIFFFHLQILSSTNLLMENKYIEFGPHQMNNYSLNAANGGYDGGGLDDSSGGLLATLCAAFCKDGSLGQQLNMNEKNNNSQQPPITSQGNSCTGYDLLLKCTEITVV